MNTKMIRVHLEKSKALSRRTRPQPGFTIIELLIVIVVIAILAAITIVAYNGITQRADVATLQSDLDGGYKTLGLYEATNGSYPTTQSSSGLKSSPSVALSYESGWGQDSNGNWQADYAYCLQGVSNGLVYAVSNNNNVPTQGYCSGGSVTPGTGNAYLNYPEGIVTTASGNVYAADSYNSCIRNITGNGTNLTTFAGICGEDAGTNNGTGAAAQFDFPYDIAMDASGNVYVTDTDNNCIRKVTPSAVVTTFAGICNSGGSTGGSANGTSSAAQFYYPDGLTFNASGNLYVADTDNNCIREITPSAVVTTFAGTCVDGGGSEGNANGTGSAAQFNFPIGLTFDSSGNLYVADTMNNCIRKITPSSVVTTFAGTCGGAAGTANGTGSAAQFNEPKGLVFDSSGNLYVADSYNSCIRKITSSAVVTTFAGTCGSKGNSDGTGSTASFDAPAFLTFDSSGNLYVTDDSGQCIRKITPSAVVTTYVGTCTPPFSGGGVPS